MPLSQEEAVELSVQSYAQHGTSHHVFVHEHKIDRVALHYDFHGFMDETLIRKSADLIDLFETAPLSHALITHATREWAVRVLNHIGLKRFFPDDAIFGMEDVNFASKARDRAPFEKPLSILGTPPHETAMIEDSVENLRIAREMGLTTVLLHYGRRPDPLPDYVCMDCNNAADFLKMMI